MQIPANIQLLIEKYQSGTATEEELNQLNEWYHSFDDSKVEVTLQINDSEQKLKDRIQTRLLQTIHQEKPVVKRPSRWRAPAVAAAMLIIIGSVYFLLNSKTKSPEVTVKQTAQAAEQSLIRAGGNKAILTLADGSSIVLDTASNGMLSDLGSVKIQKLQNGLLAYTINGKQITENDAAFYNTITTPRGGQYQVTLTDGTKVWLNAASSIRFPVVFSGKERRVQITGEAYFEVAKNKNLPFRVQAAGSEIEVLGTHFNVNAYADEASVKTTLLEGLVKVSASSSKNLSPKFIEPGQQASVDNEGMINVKDQADVEEAVAWKNGRFQFKSTDIRSILRQLSRWYDVDVVYQGNVNLHFTGLLSRNEPVDTIFKKLELTGAIHFKTEGKTIIVSP
ncbi:MAG TPA: FecR domain-containing protein [Flavisolibacter sp.]|jgi:ferric-dicitrate binding protein FerR (iron transport regulator)|nr:FecR domain-containing protein [Flavisolibacter sp.]